MQADPERDFIRLGDDFYIGFLFVDVPDESEFLRSARSVWLELKADNVEEVCRRILESGLARKLEIPDPHLSLFMREGAEVDERHICDFRTTTRAKTCRMCGEQLPLFSRGRQAQSPQPVPGFR